MLRKLETYSVIKNMSEFKIKTKTQKSKITQGFTVVEFLVVVGVSLLLVLAALPIYGNTQVSTQLNESSAQIVQDLRLARELSRSGVDGQLHGIKFQSNQYTLFEGGSYAARNTDYDRINTFSGSLTITTTFTNNEVVFSTGSGLPSINGTVIIAHSAGGTRTVILNGSGTVEDQ